MKGLITNENTNCIKLKYQFVFKWLTLLPFLQASNTSEHGEKKCRWKGVSWFLENPAHRNAIEQPQRMSAWRGTCRADHPCRLWATWMRGSPAWAQFAPAPCDTVLERLFGLQTRACFRLQTSIWLAWGVDSISRHLPTQICVDVHPQRVNIDVFH